MKRGDMALSLGWDDCDGFGGGGQLGYKYSTRYVDSPHPIVPLLSSSSILSSGLPRRRCPSTTSTLGRVHPTALSIPLCIVDLAQSLPRDAIVQEGTFTTHVSFYL